MSPPSHIETAPPSPRRPILSRRLVITALLSIAAGCAGRHAPAPASSTGAGSAGAARVSNPSSIPPPAAVVVWVSVDGFRPDYLTRPGVEAPFIQSLIRDGAYTWQLTPTYPSLTFSSHTSEVTGANPDVHGIPGNAFYDRKLNQQFSFPPRPDLLKAEPIWTAAARQGLRVAVFDWPFSQDQVNRGVTHPTDIFESRYDAKETNDTRLAKPTTRMAADVNPRPLQLFMAYTDGLDRTGHSEGPDAPRLIEELNHLDTQLAALHAAALSYTRAKFGPDASLYFLLSTDHGMAAVHSGFNASLLFKDLLPSPELRGADAPAPKGIRIVTGGATAHVFFPSDATAEQREQLEVTIRARLKPYPFCRIYTRQTQPANWHMWDADRVGDLYLDLAPGYTFVSRGGAVVVPVTDPAANAPKGMHSYDPRETPDMLGFTAMSRTPKNFGGLNLGPVDNRQLAPTVARWLGIQPPAQCQVSPLPPVTKPSVH